MRCRESIAGPLRIRFKTPLSSDPDETNRPETSSLKSCWAALGSRRPPLRNATFSRRPASKTMAIIAAVVIRVAEERQSSVEQFRGRP